MKPISASAVAAKLQAARQGRAEQFAEQLAAEPRLLELLWSLQHVSMQPGGLRAYVADLVSQYPQHFQTNAMLRAGEPAKDGRYTLDQCLSIWRANKRSLGIGESQSDEDHGRNESILEAVNLGRVSYSDFLEIFMRNGITAEAALGNSIFARALRKGHERFNFSFLQGECCQDALGLESYLERVCTFNELRLSPARCCPTLPQLLLANMERRAQASAGQIAETEVTRTVRREIEFAITECVPVPFIGFSRFGKSKAISNWCDAHPGRARLVTVPNNTSEMAFMRAHADALGIEYTSATKLLALRDEVEFVIRNSGLAIFYDEAHALIPVSYDRRTAPRRLNWVRSMVIDQNVPCAFFATPQSETDTLEQYAKVTGYNLSQWVGRMSPPVILSDEVPFEDIIAVARTHFPELSQLQLEEMADRATASAGYLKNIEMAGKRARFLARERGHEKPTMQDVMDAGQDMTPTAPRVVTATPIRTPKPRATSPARQAAPVALNMAIAPRMQSRGSAPATPLPDTDTEQFPRRSTTPARLINEPVTVS